jgi:hypothetical protein
MAASGKGPGRSPNRTPRMPLTKFPNLVKKQQQMPKNVPRKMPRQPRGG